MAFTSTISGYKRTTGAIGESYAVDYLKSKGHSIIDLNYHNSYGEIDIITIKSDCVFYTEVKTVKSHNTSPAEHMDWKKLRKTSKLAQMHYNILLERNQIGEDFAYTLNLICVYLNHNNSLRNIEFLEGLEA